MFWPFRTRTIFKNRWWTLAWAAMVLWLAHEHVQGVAEDEAAANAVETPQSEEEATKAQEQAFADLRNALDTAEQDNSQ